MKSANDLICLLYSRKAGQAPSGQANFVVDYLPGHGKISTMYQRHILQNVLNPLQTRRLCLFAGHGRQGRPLSFNRSLPSITLPRPFTLTGAKPPHMIIRGKAMRLYGHKGWQDLGRSGRRQGGRRMADQPPGPGHSGRHDPIRPAERRIFVQPPGLPDV